MTTKTKEFALDAAVEVVKLFDTGYVTESAVNVVADRIDDQMQLLALDLSKFMLEEHNVKALKLFHNMEEPLYRMEVVEVELKEDY